MGPLPHPLPSKLTLHLPHFPVLLKRAHNLVRDLEFSHLSFSFFYIENCRKHNHGGWRQELGFLHLLFFCSCSWEKTMATVKIGSTVSEDQLGVFWRSRDVKAGMVDVDGEN